MPPVSTLFSFFIALCFMVFLPGCQSLPESGVTEALSKRLSYHPSSAISGLPVSTWLYEGSKKSSVVRVYIEGDGRAWVRKNRMSTNPTPKNRLVHALMLKDKKVDIAYLGRPCHFHQNSLCRPRVWTFDRYNEDTLNTMNNALSVIKEKQNYQTIELVGFSGGATIALLLAGRRDDISSVRTIAGNLDPVFTNSLHKVTPMPSALNPADHIDTLKSIPQYHFVGADDPVVKPAIVKHYLSLFTDTHCIQSKILPGVTHHDGWVDHWEQLLKESPQCVRTRR